MPQNPLYAGGPEPFHRVAGVVERLDDRFAMSVVPCGHDDLDLRLERSPRRPLAVMIDRDDVPALSRDEVEDVSELAGTIRDQHANRQVAARAGQAEAHDRDERRRVDVPTREHDRDRVVASRLPRQQRGEADCACALDEELLPFEAEHERVRDLLVRDLHDVVQGPVEDRAGELAARLHRDPVGDREALLAHDADNPLSGDPLAKCE